MKTLTATEIKSGVKIKLTFASEVEKQSWIKNNKHNYHTGPIKKQ